VVIGHEQEVYIDIEVVVEIVNDLNYFVNEKIVELFERLMVIDDEYYLLIVLDH
jgi:hypothetical protein